VESLASKLLIASPKLRDPNFFRSVVVIVQHDDNGALGLILNRPTEVSIKQAWAEISEGDNCYLDEPLHQGGPCEGPLMVLHDRDDLSQVSVMPGLHFSTTKESIEQLIADSNQPVKFFVGYSGWSPGQLEGEIEQGAWIIAAADPSLVFDDDEELWDKLHRLQNFSQQHPWVDPRLIPPDPSVN
jgi:putative transcriptional regulator